MEESYSEAEKAFRDKFGSAGVMDLETLITARKTFGIPFLRRLLNGKLSEKELENPRMYEISIKGKKPLRYSLDDLD